MMCPDAECIGDNVFIIAPNGRLYHGSIWECEKCGWIAMCCEREFGPSVECVVSELLERPARRN